MELKFEQIQSIVKDNPNKGTIDKGKKLADKLMLHLYGLGMDNAIEQCKEFANDNIYQVQKQYAISNKDVFSRLLQQEDMIFTARGGSSHYHLPDAQENQMNEILDSVRYGLSLRKWIRNFALPAYRSDPMGIVFMEIEQLTVAEDGSMNEPRVYPTYKSIYSIYDYATTGRKLEYVCFKLSAGECRAYGIQDDTLKGVKPDAETKFYRVVDDAKDVIVKFDNGVVSLVENILQKNPIGNEWGKTPGFILSDLILFNDPSQFVSPVDFIVELADCFLFDRSVRELQKKYHGFAKAVEPLLSCPTCVGTGFLGGHACPSCTPAGADKGTGYKLKTRVSDVAKFPLEIVESGFDFKKIFGYVSPDIDGWNKQDSSLEDLEELMEMTYWGTVRMKRPQPGSGQIQEPRTATEVDSNDAPKEARLNMTADWAESTENMIADFIGLYWFDQWKKSSISYGRDYILKTADELLDLYLTLRTKGAPDFTLDEALEKYYQAKYQNNPVIMVKYLKMLDVEPFPHLSISNAKGVITDFNDYNCKLYFGEWCDTLPQSIWLTNTAVQLRELLKTYVSAKAIPEPVPQPNPANN